MWAHTVAILVGGQSRRMGSPKHAVILPNGKTMIEMMMHFATESAARVVIVGGEVDGYRAILDKRVGGGPVAGIEALLDSNLDREYLVVGCDMPNLKHEDVQPLLDCEGTSHFTAGGMSIPLPLKVSGNERTACTAYLDSGGRSISGFIQSIPHTALPISNEHAHVFTSLNSPKDVADCFDSL